MFSYDPGTVAFVQRGLINIQVKEPNCKSWENYKETMSTQINGTIDWTASPYKNWNMPPFNSPPTVS